jgi:hypothetical protein
MVTEFLIKNQRNTELDHHFNLLDTLTSYFVHCGFDKKNGVSKSHSQIFNHSRHERFDT